MANLASTIQFAPDLFGTIQLNSQLNITNSGNNQFTDFSIAAGANVSISGLTIAQGHSEGSAIDAGDPNMANNPNNSTTDQRGVTRPQGAIADIGAFESIPYATPITIPNFELIAT